MIKDKKNIFSIFETNFTVLFSNNREKDSIIFDYRMSFSIFSFYGYRDDFVQSV